jgi:hypothetical protein
LCIPVKCKYAVLNTQYSKKRLAACNLPAVVEFPRLIYATLHPSIRMKNFLMPLALLLALWATAATAQTHEETFRRSVRFSGTEGKRTLRLHNLKGDVTVEAYAGDAVEFEVEKTVSADTREGLERGRQETDLRIEERGGTVVVYVASPRFEWRGDGYGSVNFNEDDAYQFAFNLRVRVPAGVDTDVSSLGKVHMDRLRGAVRARGHHGLTLTGITGPATASAHHGDLVATFAGPIPDGSSFRTHHGDIRVTVPGQPDADIVFDSYYGEFYTDFAVVEALPARVKKTVSGDEKSKTYRLDERKAIRLGKGGTAISFKSHHGSFFLVGK